MEYRNPIISGYNPDPSICRVGEDYYIVNSTFEFFPGVPIYHSKNLINWELIGYCLTNEGALPLKNARASGGIFAPTLRYHDGYFFMTTTNVTSKGNFIVHTKDIRGEWSDPVWIDQGGIDPSLLFDEDGKVYFTSTGMDGGKQGIFMCEVDPFTGERKTESVCISHGCGGRYPEGPHLYKMFGKYYLMLAEGGTEYGHMETMQRADTPYGPYEACPSNPILTNRDDMRDMIHGTGHADLVEDTNDNWWMVCLAFRTCSTKEQRVLLHNLGRETFLAPVSWTPDGWPIVGTNGGIETVMDGPLPASYQHVERSFSDRFTSEKLSLHYNFLRNPRMENYILDTEEQELILKGTSITLNELDSPTWIGIRQKGFETEATAKIRLIDVAEGMRAGLTAFYNDSYHYDLALTKNQEGICVNLYKQVHDIFVNTQSRLLGNIDTLYLKIKTDQIHYTFYYSADGQVYEELGKGLTIGLCTEGTKTMTFTGTYLAMFAEKCQVAFQDFEVKVLDY